MFGAILAGFGVVGVGFTDGGEDTGREEVAAFATIPNAGLDGFFERQSRRSPRDGILCFPEEELSGVRIDQSDAQPLVVDEFFDVGKVGEDALKACGALFDDHQEADRFVDLDHLPRESRLKIAEVAVDHADVSRDVVWEFGSSAIERVVDVGEEVFEVDAGTDGDNGVEDGGQGFDLVILGGVVGDEEGATVEIEVSGEVTSSDDAKGVGGVSTFGSGFGDITGAFFDVFEGFGRAEMERERLETSASFVGIATAGFVEDGADLLEALLVRRGELVKFVVFDGIGGGIVHTADKPSIVGDIDQGLIAEGLADGRGVEGGGKDTGVGAALCAATSAAVVGGFVGVVATA